MMGFFTNWNADHTLSAIALIGAGIAFVIGLLQYRKSQQWKRAEWVAQELKAFFGDVQVDAAFKMIDWGGRHIALYPEKEASARFVFVASDEVFNALRHHSERPRESEDLRFSEKEAAIRDAFDKLCEGLERIESYIDAGLIEQEDVAPYLEYWGTHLGPDPPDPRLGQVRNFMASYGYDRALNLLDRFGAQSHDARR